MSEQPEALRIADWFEGGYGGCELEAAAELRRLHQEVEHLRLIVFGFENKLATRGYEIQIDDLKAEITRLNEALQYEQHRAERIGTHGWGCWSWGPKHYECALAKIRELEDDGK